MSNLIQKAQVLFFKSFILLFIITLISLLPLIALEDNIRFHRISIEKGTFAPLEGQLELIKIFYDEGYYDKALEECRSIENEFRLNTV